MKHLRKREECKKSHFNVPKLLLLILLFTNSRSFAQNIIADYDRHGGHNGMEWNDKIYLTKNETGYRLHFNNLPEYNATGVCQNLSHWLDYSDDFSFNGSRNDGSHFSNHSISNNNIGPYKDVNVSASYHWGANNTGCGSFWVNAKFPTIKTDKVKAVSDVSVSTKTENGVTFPNRLTWTKKTDITSSYISFIIFQKKGNANPEQIALVSGSTVSYTINTTGMESGDYSYSVKTVLSENAPSAWNRSEESTEPAVSSNRINVLTKNLTATQDESNKIKLTWSSVSAVLGVEAIVLYKYPTGSTSTHEEVATLSKASKAYTDLDIIPGKSYTYYIKLTPDQSGTNLNAINNYKSVEGAGYSLANGKLSGYVKSSTGVGIANTTLTATSSVALNDGRTNALRTYSSTTDATGYYEIPNIYYDKSADYVITPKLLTYTNRHDPANITRKLTLDEYNVKNINFTDTASFTIKGLVYFPLVDQNSVKFKMEADSVEIYVDGTKKTVTNNRGEYNLSFPVQGNHHIAAYYKGHQILPSNDPIDGTTNSYTERAANGIITKKSNDGKYDLKGLNLEVNKNFTNLNFINLQTDTLKINVYATDGKFAIGEESLVSVYPVNPDGLSNTNAFSKLSVLSNGNRIQQGGGAITGNGYTWNNVHHVKVDENKGYAEVVLPSTRYQVKVSNVLSKQNKNAQYSGSNSLENTNQQIFFDRIPQSIFLGKRDSILVTKTEITKCFPLRDTTEVIKGRNGQDSTIFIAACSKIKDTVDYQVKVLKPLNPLNFVYHKDVEIIWHDEHDGGTIASDLLLAGKNRLPANVTNQWNANQRGSSSLYLMTQNDQNVLSFNIAEKYRIYDDEEYSTYLVDSALIEVYDQIGDLTKQTFDYKALTLKEKSRGFTYNLVPGMPNFSSLPFYDKSFQIYASLGVGGSTIRVSKLIYALVQGEREEEGKGVTVTPNIPFMVLHRPPGDNSYAKISKGSKFSWKSATKYGKSGSAGVNVKGAYKFAVPRFSFDVTTVAGRDNDGERGTETTLTITEDIQTSDSENNIGQRGDIIFLNSNALSYGVYKKLRYTTPKNGASGSVNSFSDVAFADQGIASSVMFTYAHIVDTEIPKLGKMIENNNIAITSEQGRPVVNTSYVKAKQVENANLQEQIKAYEKIIYRIDSVQNIAQNSKDQLKPFYKTMVQDVMSNYLDDSDADNEVKKNLKNTDGNLYALQKNITFSNGVDYTFNVENSMAAIDNFSYEVYVNLDASTGLTFGDEDATFIGFGAVASMHSIVDSKVIDRTGETTSSIEIHLADKNPGDYYSVDMLVDPLYNTPLFAVYGGASSCPWVPGTLQRDKPVISVVGAQKQTNVPADKPASFTIQLGNESATDEGRQYNVKVNPRSNMLGARILIGGQEINNGVATFYVAPKDSARVVLEVWRGPLAYQYENLELYIGTTCENLETDNSDDLGSAIKSTKVSVGFSPSCGSVDLFKPGSNWLVSSLNNDRLQVTFNKFDANNPNLKWIGLEYRRKTGQNAGTIEEQWKEVVTIKPEQLQDAFYDYLLDVSQWQDGEYELRAKSVCTDGYFFSDVYAGRIDRTSLNVYGLPEPQDGILGVGKSLSVTYNAVLAPSQPTLKIKLTRKDTGVEIPVTYTMSANSSSLNIIPVNGDSVFDELENIELNAEVSGAIANNANVQSSVISWDFVINRSALYWSPRNIEVTATENVQSSFNAKLVNKTAKDQTFTLTKYPTWLNPLVKTGKIVPFGEMNIDFIVNKNLNTGTYTDTVTAEVNGKKQWLHVTVDVLRTAPNWVVDASKYKYNMNLTAQFSFNQTDDLTSRDIKDKFGVFVGKECRGTAQVVFDEVRNKYVAYITAYSNQAADEQLSIHFWDAYPGIEYQAKENITFVANGSTGNLVNPVVFHPSGVYQTIPVKQGWTWLSLNVKSADMSVNNVLSNLTPTDGDVIKSLSNNNAYSQYSKALGWVGSLTDLDVYNSYMISVAKPDTVRLLGNFVTDAVNVKLNKGWNWMGYPMAINMDIATYLKNFEPANGSQIVSQEEFATFNSATKTWSGSLKYLRPGKGYKFYSDADGFTIPVVTYTPTNNPATETLMQHTPPVNFTNTTQVNINNNSTVNSSVTNNSVNTVNSENNMSVTTVINQGGNIVNNTTNRYETNVFVENKLVTVINQTTLNNGSSVGFLPVNATPTDAGKQIDIRIYDREEKRTYNAKLKTPITQNPNEIVGTVTSPVELVIEGDADVAITSSIPKAQFNVGENFDYVIKIKNNGPDLAVNAKTVDTLSNHFDVVSTSSNITYDAVKRTFTANKLQIATGEEERYVITLKPVKVGAFTLGKGNVSINNDINLTNNTIAALSLNVIDQRADANRLVIPQMFTPNGDGYNDVFHVVGLNEFFVNNSLTIYNKGYNVVYKKENYQNDWNANNLPIGSYGYILKVVDKEGKETVYKGYVSVVY